MGSNKIHLYALIRFSISFAFGTILPVYVLYFRHYQINLFEIGLLAAIFEASIMVFEIPTGLVADVFGRRISVVLSAFVSLISGLVFIFFPFLTGFIIAEIVSGLGETLRSGALEAWLVDSMKHEGKDGEIKSALAQGTKFKTGGNLLGLILGGYLASIDMRLVWVPFTLIFLFLCFFLILKMKEEYVTGHAQGEKVFSRLSEITSTSWKVIKTQRLILALLVLSLFFEFSYETVSQFWQVHFSEGLAIGTKYFGWILAGASVFTILLIDKVTKLSEKLRHEVSSLIILQVLFLFSLLVIALTSSPLWAIVFFILLQSMVNFQEPIFLDLFNKNIPSSQRATLLSFQSLVGSGGEALAGLCIGLVAQACGLRLTFGLGTMVLLAGIVAFILFTTIKRK
jgi:DHA3 family tetracycline resistance protein-like MFS transporter